MIMLLKVITIMLAQASVGPTDNAININRTMQTNSCPYENEQHI